MPSPEPPPSLPADVTLAETLDRVLETGAVLRGDVVITVADVDLLYLDLRVLLSAVDTAVEHGAAAPSPQPSQPSASPSDE
jgi:hypothetical protein